jgi:hypothetical protein
MSQQEVSKFYQRIALFFESVSVLLVFTGIVLTMLNLI